MSILLASSRILSRNILVKNVTKTIKCNSILQKALISFGNGLQKNMVVQAIKYRPGETVDDKNARLNRPLTPHLTIYRPQLTSILSILHRIAGFILSCYLFWFAVSSLVLPEKYDYYMDEAEVRFKKEKYPDWMYYIPKLLLTIPFVYHLWNGIRHLIFDLLPKIFLTMPQVYLTGGLVILLTLLGLGFTSLLPRWLYDAEKKAEEQLTKGKPICKRPKPSC